jgi:hypothetical protein
MRVLRRFPSLEPALRDGRLCISTIPLLGQVLTPENVEDLLARAAFKTKAEVDHLVASIQPRPAPKNGIRKLPERGVDGVISSLPLASPAESPFTTTPVTATLSLSPAPAFEAVQLPAPAPLPAPPPRRTAPEIRALSETDWSLRVTVDAAFKADLGTLRDLLSHKIPDGDLASVLREAIRCAIDKHGKRRGTVAPSRKTSPRGVAPARASGESPLAAEPPPASTRPSAQVRREVTARDGARCAWIGVDGRRCGSTWQLEFDHVQVAALGGKATVDEMRVLCRPHNMLHAEQVFGREYMAQFRGGRGFAERQPSML